jgi:hypothetical protein
MVTKNFDKANWVLFVAFVLLLSVGFCCCITPKKAVSYLKQKDLLDDTCAANYPVKADTVYREGEVIVVTEERIDTVQVTDTLVEGFPVMHEIYRTRIVNRFKTDTVRIVKVDSAAVSAIRRELQKANATAKQHAEDAAKWKTKAQTRSKWQWGSIAVNAILLLLIGYMAAKMKNHESDSKRHSTS